MLPNFLNRRAFVLLPLLFLLACEKSGNVLPPNAGDTVVNVDADLFAAADLTEPITTVACRLSDGTESTCFRLVVRSIPRDHRVGPWCPTHVSDTDSAGGIWLEKDHVHDVDGHFVKNMAEFYQDDAWKMYDAEGNIYVTKTREECAAAARPDVDPKYHNHCVECLPGYVSDITNTYLIPVTPHRQATATAFARGRGRGVSVRGVAFNGVRFDAPAPTDAILGARTLAPFDDAGGHINLNAGYHYHAATGMTTEVKSTDGHAPMIGYALDGHGLYAHLDAAGNEATDLDDCRGHYDDVRGYHYHVDAAGSNNFINCLGGAYATE